MQPMKPRKDNRLAPSDKALLAAVKVGAFSLVAGAVVAQSVREKLAAAKVLIQPKRATRRN